jgi:hypothetical protein
MSSGLQYVKRLVLDCSQDSCRLEGSKCGVRVVFFISAIDWGAIVCVCIISLCYMLLGWVLEQLETIILYITIQYKLCFPVQ